MLSKAEEENLKATMSERISEVIAVIAAIDARKAKATWQGDKIMIFEKIEKRSGGFDAFNADIAAQLRAWLLATAKRLLAEGNGDDFNLCLGVATLENQLGFLDDAMLESYL